MKMNIYRKRQITAAVFFVLFVFLVVLMIKCTAGLIKNSKNSDSDQVEMSDEYTVPNADIPEIVKFTENEKKVTHEFIPYEELTFEKAELLPEDVSLMSEKYMDDVVIIGDSITKGYSVYGRLKDDNVLATGSIGIRNVLETEFDYQGYKLGITDILGRKKPKYIFISLGMNDLNWRSEEQYISDFQNFISEIQKVSPDSCIIVTAVTPVSRQTDFTENSKIDLYNEDLRKMVFDYNSDKIYYVNAARYLKGDDNYLISEFSSGDGIHLSAGAYDYLLTCMLSMLDWI